MPGSDTSSSVCMSFANNFWGKDDAGVEPLIQRMQSAKATCEELKNFYSVRAAIEEDYAKKLLSLSRKPFGSCESGTLKASMDTLRTETEASGKAHQNIAQQMKSDLEEPLARYTGSLRERRKLVQGGIEKLLKLKITQTQAVNKTRDRYEQDCLRIKGYLAQGHMVMGQEERKNKQKLEKTQAALVHSNAEYQAAIKALEETTERWNREWKAACDVFQDLEEERIDTLKSSMWSFANIASTVCVSDDASCEKVRVALENCEVEKDITSFIRDKGTGSEIPDAPKYINFSRGDHEIDNQSEVSENFSVAHFSRAGKPTYRSSSPTSTYSRSTVKNGDARRRSSTASHDIEPSTPGRSPPMDRRVPISPTATNPNFLPTLSPLDKLKLSCRTPVSDINDPGSNRPESSHGGAESEYSAATSTTSSSNSDGPRRGGTLKGPSSQKYPPNTQHYGSVTTSPTSPREDDAGSTKKRGFFGGNSPFSRRKSKSEKHQQQILQQQQQQQIRQQQQQQQQYQQHQQYQQQQQQQQHQQPDKNAISRPQHRMSQYQPQQQGQVMPPPSHRNTWGPEAARGYSASGQGSINTRSSTRQSHLMGGMDMRDSTEPVDPRANFQLNVGENVFDIASPDGRPQQSQQSQQGHPQNQQQQLEEQQEEDPIVLALAELKGVTGGGSNAASASQGGSIGPNSSRKPVDRFYGLSTPAPANNGSTTTLPLSVAGPGMTNDPQQRNTPPPSYNTQPAPLNPKRSALNAPAPAHDAASMQQTLKRYKDQTAEYMLDGGPPPTIPAAANGGSGPPSRTGSGTSMRDRTNTMDYRPSSRQVQHRNSAEVARAPSPNPMSNQPRSISPRPPSYDARYASSPNPQQPQQMYDARGPSPNPYNQPPPQQYQQYNASPRPQTTTQPAYKRASTIDYYQAQTQQQTAAMRGRSPSPNPMMMGGGAGGGSATASYRPYSPNPQAIAQQQSQPSMGRPRSQHGGSFSQPPMQMDSHTGALAHAPARGRNSFYDQPSHMSGSSSQLALAHTPTTGGHGRPRSKSVVDTSRALMGAPTGPQYSRDGRPILYYARAMYMYNAAIPEELSFNKGDVMAILRVQDDGWWEAELVDQIGGAGLVPSNYLQRV